MTPERWQQVEDVLQGALDRAPAERAVYLNEACLGDEELTRETSSLLDAYDEARDFMEEPAIAQDAQVIINSLERRNVGREIGPYKIIDRIGSGGMGEIYLAHDSRLDRLVVLKILRAYFMSDDERLRRFQIEARAASSLSHANILTIYDVGHFEDNLFIATEYIDGSTIRERIRAGDLSLGEVLEIVDQLLCGLDAAHEVGIVHRDIKPENVMQRRDGVVKILDFGIAKLLERLSSEDSPTTASGSTTQTEVGVMLGTIGYMSPEQVRGLAIDERTDVWSCGVVLYEMLTQHRPFNGTTNADTIVAMLEREPEPPFGIDQPAAPILRQIQAIVYKALRKDPAERYQTAAGIRADLAQIEREIKTSKESTRQRGINSQTNVRDLPKLAASPRISREILILISAGLLVAFFAATFLYQQLKTQTASNVAPTAANKPYLRMSEPEQLAFVAAQEQRISAMMGDRPVKLNDEALRAIKTHVDRYAARQDSASLKFGEESLRTVYARAAPQIPIIARAFEDRRIPNVVGLYLPMIESEYKPCFENEAGAKGLFQFLPATAEHYGVARADMCDVQKVAPAAAHYIADRMAELGDDAQSMTLVLLSYNRGPNGVTEALRRLREIDANYERNFWTLFANRDKLDETFQRESAGYVPAFFAAAIIGENPEAFDLQMPALSSLASEATQKR
jgi:serine/threonine protein kinase